MGNRGRIAIEIISQTRYRVEQMELRKRVRHRLAADAEFTWEGAERTCLHGEGVTRDISLSGAYIFSLTCPPVGATIQLDVSLLQVDSRSRTLRSKTGATVIRVEHANTDGDEGFAVVLEGLSLTEGANDLCAAQ
jgi:hypothetical protein